MTNEDQIWRLVSQANAADTALGRVRAAAGENAPQIDQALQSLIDGGSIQLHPTAGDLERGYRWSRSGQWNGSTAERADAYAASLAVGSYAIGGLCGDLHPGEPLRIDGSGIVGAASRLGWDHERVRAAAILQRAHVYPALLNAYERPSEAAAGLLQSSGIITPAETTGWLIPLAIVVGGAVYAVTACVGISTAGSVVDNYLSRSQNLKKLQEEHAQALALVAQHVKAEVEAGRSLPMSDATKSALAASDARADEIAKTAPAPLRPMFDGAGAGGFKPLKLGLGLGAAGAVIALGVGAWALSR